MIKNFPLLSVLPFSRTRNRSKANPLRYIGILVSRFFRVIAITCTCKSRSLSREGRILRPVSRFLVYWLLVTRNSYLSWIVCSVIESCIRVSVYRVPCIASYLVSRILNLVFCIRNLESNQVANPFCVCIRLRRWIGPELRAREPWKPTMIFFVVRERADCFCFC